MEIVNDITPLMLDYWRAKDPDAQGIVMRGGDIPGVDDCGAVVTHDAGIPEVHVAWRPTLAEVELLEDGGVIWLTCMGGLPPHRIEVQGPPT